jgi:pimeloyl-ACP methyl ester carboxylesterase
VPVLVIMGEKSIWTSVGDGERVQKSYPVSQLVVLKESAMMPWFDENEKFTQAVKDFLKRHPLKKGK